MFIKKLSPIQKNTVIILIAIGILKIAGFVKDITLAGFFGVDRSVDIYFYALILPTLFFNIASSSFRSFFIPVYIKIKKERGQEHVKRYTSLIFRYAAVALLLIGVLCAKALPYVITKLNSGFFSSHEAVITFLHFSHWTAVFFFFYVLSSFLSSLFQAEHRYAYSFYPQLAIPLAIILFIIFGNKEYHIASAVYGMTIGTGICFFVLVSGALRIKLISLFPKQLAFAELRENIEQLGILIASFIFPCMIRAVDQYMAGNLGEGKLSALSYGIRIPDGFAEIIGAGLGIAAFSYFSHWVVENKKKELIEATQRIIIFSTIFIIPLCIYLMLYAESLINIIFERGAFSSAATFNVGEILRFYAPVAYFYIINVIGARLISAFRKNQFLLLFGAVNLGAKILLNLLFISLVGLKGIPIATSGMFMISICLMFWFLVSQGIVVFEKRLFGQLASEWVVIIFIFLGMFFVSQATQGYTSLFRLSIGFCILILFLTIILAINKKHRFIHFEGFKRA